jgi:NSS family neurotransmitter:Na+ symporter
MKKRGSWRTRFGFYLVAIGSACGLGNLWRFPYVVGENGGGAFVLLYVLMAFVLGAPLLIGELILGKHSRASVMKATLALEEPGGKGIRWRWAGRAAVLASVLALSYYSVIAGWVLHFIVQFGLGLLSSKEIVSGGLDVLMKNGWLQWALASVHLLITLIVVGRGVQEGLERWISFLMPFFAVLVGLLVYQAMSLPSAPEVLRFLFYPDFSKLTSTSLIHAIGHVLFTLSVGFGTMVTFGSYFHEDDHTPTAGFRVAVVDTLVSLIVGLLIFPLAFQATGTPMTDPGLLFEVLPRFLLTMPGGLLFGFFFFVSLYLAALNASIGLFESIVANMADLLPKTAGRQLASWLTGVVILLLSLFPAFSSSVFQGFRIGGKSLIENLDGLLVNLLLPLVAVFLIFATLRGIDQRDLKKHYVDSHHAASAAMWPHWYFMVRWVVPWVIIFAMLLSLKSWIF